MVDALSPVLSAAVRAQAKAPAYLDAAQITKSAGTAASTAPEDFTSMLAQMFTNTKESLGKAEATSIAAIQGKATVQEAVQAVMAADQSLQAAIAIRDKIASAYLELSRMAI